jgi:hypothetical protein
VHRECDDGKMLAVCRLSARAAVRVADIDRGLSALTAVVGTQNATIRDCGEALYRVLMELPEIRVRLAALEARIERLETDRRGDLARRALAPEGPPPRERPALAAMPALDKG